MGLGVDLSVNKAVLATALVGFIVVAPVKPVPLEPDTNIQTAAPLPAYEVATTTSAFTLVNTPPGSLNARLFGGKHGDSGSGSSGGSNGGSSGDSNGEPNGGSSPGPSGGSHDSSSDGLGFGEAVSKVFSGHGPVASDTKGNSDTPATTPTISTSAEMSSSDVSDMPSSGGSTQATVSSSSTTPTSTEASQNGNNNSGAGNSIPGMTNSTSTNKTADALCHDRAQHCMVSAVAVYCPSRPNSSTE